MWTYQPPVRTTLCGQRRTLIVVATPSAGRTVHLPFSRGCMCVLCRHAYATPGMCACVRAWIFRTVHERLVLHTSSAACGRCSYAGCDGLVLEEEGYCVVCHHWECSSSKCAYVNEGAFNCCVFCKAPRKRVVTRSRRNQPAAKRYATHTPGNYVREMCVCVVITDGGGGGGSGLPGRRKKKKKKKEEEKKRSPRPYTCHAPITVVHMQYNGSARCHAPITVVHMQYSGTHTGIVGEQALPHSGTHTGIVGASKRSLTCSHAVIQP